MGDYNIDINVNMGAAGGSFQDLITSVNNLNASFKKVGEAGSDAGNKTKQSFTESMKIIANYKGGITELTAEIAKQKKQIVDINQSLRTKTISETKHKEEIDKVTKSLKILQTAQRQYNTVLGQTTANTKTAVTGVNSLTNAFNKLGAVLGVSFGLYGVFRVLQDGVKTVADFDLEMKKLQSILGETADGMNDIRQSAIDIGKNSIFGAKGVAELSVELAKMGFSKGNIIDMTQAIVNLATATQEDLASAAEVTANVLRAYQLDATEATRVTNVMGKSFNDSALDLANFREAIKYVGTVAAQAGFSFEETVAALELLSQVGIKGSLAGTGLNNVLRAMMDANSKLSKSLGYTAKGFEGFRTVLQKAKDEGWDTEKVFGVITQRATAAFTTFQNGVETLDNFKNGLENVGDIMQDQTNVQLGSLTNQAKLTKEAFHNLWLTIDNGEGVLAKTGKAFMAFLRLLVRGEGLKSDFIETLDKQIYSLGETIRLATAQAPQSVAYLTAIRDQLIKNRAIIDKNTEDWFQLNATYYKQNAEKASEAISATILKMAETQVKAFKDAVKQGGEVEAQFKRFTTMFTTLRDNEKEGSQQQLVYIKTLELLDKEYAKLKVTTAAVVLTEEELKKLEQERLKTLRERYQAELELLKLQKSLDSEKIKMAKEGYEELYDLETNNYAYNVMIAKKTLDMQIALGEDRSQVTKEYNLKMETYAIEFSNNMQSIQEKMNKELLKEESKMLEESLKLRNKYSKDYVESWKKQMEDLDAFMAQFKFDNPIVAKLFGQTIDEGLFAGLFTEDEAKQFAAGFATAFDSIGDSLNDYVDSWVDATDRVVDQLNRQIDETQSALDTEVELMTAGYANNVTLKRKELEDLKKLREDAIEDQKKAAQAQVAIDTVTQLTSLITAAAQIFKGMSILPPLVGIPLAIGLIAAMFGAFAAAKAKAYETAGVPKFEKGGEVGGRRHSEGGTHIEAEKGEFIINRKSAIKHKMLIEAINDDNKYEMNRIYLNKMKGQIVTAKVSLDDSKYLKGIYERLGKDGKTVEYSGGYRIERFGNTTTKIRLN